MAEQDPKFKQAADQVAAEAGGRALAWRIQDDTIVVVMVDGRKIIRPLKKVGKAATGGFDTPPALREVTQPPAAAKSEKKGKGQHEAA